MHRSCVLRGARVAEAPRQVRAEDLNWPGLGLDAPREEPPLYSERQVEELLAGVKAEAHAEGRQAGHDEGRYAGYEDGLREGVEVGRLEERAQLQAAGEELAAIADALMNERTRILAGAAGDLTRLALAMVERIVRRNLAVEHETVVRALREALGHVGEARRITVRLNPREMSKVEACLEDLGALTAEGARIELRPDPVVTAGGCLVDTPDLHLDASVEGLLERFEEALQACSEQMLLEAGEEPARPHEGEGEGEGARDAA